MYKNLPQYGTKITTKDGEYKVLQVVVRREASKKPLVTYFGGVSLKWNKNSYINDEIVKPILFNRSELIQRLIAQECELCGSTESIEVHHIHKLTDLKKKGHAVLPKWKRWMLTKTRKTLVVCKECHRRIHDGKYDGRKLAA